MGRALSGCRALVAMALIGVVVAALLSAGVPRLWPTEVVGAGSQDAELSSGTMPTSGISAPSVTSPRMPPRQSPRADTPPANQSPAYFRPGNAIGAVPVPADMGLEDVSKPDHVIGNGTPAGCTSAAVLAAVTAGGVVTFNCGPEPLTIELTKTAKVRNSTRKLVTASMHRPGRR